MRAYDNVGRQLSVHESIPLWKSERHVGSTQVGPFWVSTVHLILDHSLYEDGVPIIFETMVFRTKGRRGDELDVDRYATAQEAREGHEQMVMKYRRWHPWRKVVDKI